MCVLSSLFSPIPKEGVGIERERGSSEQKWEERMKVSSLKKTDMLFCTTFSSCNMCLLPFYSTSPICLSPALSLSLFFYLSLPLCRCLVILTSASQHLSLALQESFPVQSEAWFPQISPFAPYVLWDWRRHAFYICGFFKKNLPKSSATLNPKSFSSSVASEDEAGPFLRNGFKKMYLAFL